MKNFIQKLVLSLCLIASSFIGFAQQLTTQQVKDIWDPRIMPSVDNINKTWDSFWNMQTDGPVPVPANTWVKGGNTFTATSTFGMLTNHGIRVFTNSNTRMFFDANGCIGVGTTTLTDALFEITTINTNSISVGQRINISGTNSLGNFTYGNYITNSSTNVLGTNYGTAVTVSGSEENNEGYLATIDAGNTSGYGSVYFINNDIQANVSIGSDYEITANASNNSLIGINDNISNNIIGTFTLVSANTSLNRFTIAGTHTVVGTTTYISISNTVNDNGIYTISSFTASGTTIITVVESITSSTITGGFLTIMPQAGQIYGAYHNILNTGSSSSITGDNVIIEDDGFSTAVTAFSGVISGGGNIHPSATNTGLRLVVNSPESDNTGISLDISAGSTNIALQVNSGKSLIQDTAVFSSKLIFTGSDPINNGSLYSDASGVASWAKPNQYTRSTTTYSAIANTTLTAVPGLTTMTLTAGAAYQFEAMLFVNTSTVSSGAKFSIAGSATATSIIYNITYVDNTTGLNIITSRQTALGASGSGASLNSGYAIIRGTIVVNAAGTLVPQFAQNTASNTSSVLAGSYFTVNKIQ